MSTLEIQEKTNALKLTLAELGLAKAQIDAIVKSVHLNFVYSY